MSEEIKTIDPTNLGEADDIQAATDTEVSTVVHPLELKISRLVTSCREEKEKADTAAEEWNKGVKGKENVLRKDEEPPCDHCSKIIEEDAVPSNIPSEEAAPTDIIQANASTEVVREVASSEDILVEVKATDAAPLEASSTTNTAEEESKDVTLEATPAEITENEIAVESTEAPETDDKSEEKLDGEDTDNLQLSWSRRAGKNYLSTNGGEVYW